MVRKIKDPPARPCNSPQHNPPNMIVLPPGTYEHVCPKCKKVIVFVVGAKHWGAHACGNIKPLWSYA